MINSDERKKEYRLLSIIFDDIEQTMINLQAEFIQHRNPVEEQQIQIKLQKQPYIQFIVSFQTMGLFYWNEVSAYKEHGSQSWQREGMLMRNKIPQISGKFFERASNGLQVEMNFQVDHQKIYSERSGTVRWLPLYLTVMEEDICYDRKKKLYGLKLMRERSITVLYTYNDREFIDFYCHLAKYCILTHFQQHFRVTKEIGSGAFSHVYEGFNLLSNQPVALKVLRKKELLEHEDGKEIISNEILILEKLKQFQLSPLIQVYETDDCLVFVMLKAEAGNMMDFIASHPQNYSSEMVQLILKKLLQNLKQLHAAGFIHRDVKPQNILFTSHSSTSSLFLTDYGLSAEKQGEDTSVRAKCSGTLGFMAPQILHNNSYDQKCDMFSAGCLFYLLTTGKSIFESLDIKQAYQKTFNNRYISAKIKALEGRISQDAIALLTSLLSIDPSDRPSAECALQSRFFHEQSDCTISLNLTDVTLQEFIRSKITKYWLKFTSDK